MRRFRKYAVAGFRKTDCSLVKLAVRLMRLTDAIPLLRFLFVDDPLEATVDDLTDKRLDLAAACQAFVQSREFVATLEPYDLEHIGDGLIKIGQRNTSSGKAGPFLGRMLLAVTGRKVSPPLFESVLPLSRKRILDRLDQAIQILLAGQFRDDWRQMDLYAAHPFDKYGVTAQILDCCLLPWPSIFPTMSMGING
jgi:hypothetical protein